MQFEIFHFVQDGSLVVCSCMGMCDLSFSQVLSSLLRVKCVFLCELPGSSDDKGSSCNAGNQVPPWIQKYMFVCVVVCVLFLISQKMETRKKYSKMP